jgi:hypothetical protein
MKTKHVFRILSVFLLVIMTLTAASPAYADTHVQEVIQVDDSWVWSGSDIDTGKPSTDDRVFCYRL